MATARDLETTIAGWYKDIPHLPTGLRQWLADNVWWLALIGAILSVLGLFAVVPLLFSLLTIGSLISSTASIYAPASSYGYGGIFWLSLLITLVSYVVTTVLLVMSVSPLKVKSKRGWELLFWSYLINFGLAAVSAIVSFAVLSFVSAVIGALVGGYFLFETRSYFGGVHRVVKKAKEVKTVKKV